MGGTGAFGHVAPLWLILFSVKLPLRIGAAGAVMWRHAWLSVQKMTFKAIAFLQLSILWKGLRRIVPMPWLDRKRRFDYRVARVVVRRRRLTVRQLAERKDKLPFRTGLLLDSLFGTGKRRGRLGEGLVASCLDTFSDLSMKRRRTSR